MSSPESEVKHFENENISVNATVLPDCQIKFDCTATTSLVKKSYQEALNRVRKEVSIPGFRKGKAPDSIITKNYSDVIDREWKDLLLNNTFGEAVELTSLQPLKAATHKISHKIHKMGNHHDQAELSFEFESLPNPPSIDLEQIKLEPVTTIDVKEEEIDKKVEDARLKLAAWTTITDRAAQADDYVTISLKDLNSETEDSNAKNQFFQVNSKSMSQWLIDLIIGMHPGETKEGMSKPEEALNEELAKNVVPSLFRVTLESIQTPDLPPVDNEFAKRLGVTTLEEVRAAMKRQIQKAHEVQELEDRIKKVEDLLAELYHFELPPTLVKKDTENFINHNKQKNAQSTQAQSSEEIEKEAKAAAERHLKLFYLLRKYNDDHQIKITQQDLNQEIYKLLQSFPQEMIPMLAKSLNDDFYTAIMAEVTVRRGIENILSKLK